MKVVYIYIYFFFEVFSFTTRKKKKRAVEKTHDDPCCVLLKGHKIYAPINLGNTYNIIMCIGVCAPFPRFRTTSNDPDNPVFVLYAIFYFGLPNG